VVLGAMMFQLNLDAAAILPQPVDLQSYGMAAPEIAILHAGSQVELGSAKNFNCVRQLIEQMNSGFANRHSSKALAQHLRLL
jgi:hypothetical protein